MRRVALLLVVALAVLGVALPAQAGPPDVRVVNNGNITIADADPTTGHPSVTCSGVNMPGVAGTAPVVVASPTSSSVTGCVPSAGLTATVTASGTWDLNVPGSGSPYWSGVHLHVVFGLGCAFDATGTISGSYSASTGLFVASSAAGLVLSGATGAACALLPVSDGDPVSVTGTLQVVSVTITGSLVLRDTSSPNPPVISCSSVLMGGVTATSPLVTASPAPTSIGGCTPSGAALTGLGSWSLFSAGWSGVQLRAALSGCTFTASGTVPGTYNVTTGVFTASAASGLTISATTGSLCAVYGISNGQLANLTGTLTITAVP